MSLKRIIKYFQIAGKGENEVFEIVNPFEPRGDTAVVVGVHVPENGGTWIEFHFLTFTLCRRTASR
jgi:hypothetical protein